MKIREKIRDMTGYTSRDMYTGLSLKGKAQRKMRFHLFFAGYDVAFLGLMLGLEFGTHLYHSRLSAGYGEILLLALLAYNLIAVRRIRAILRSPLFYLAAIRHDLGGQNHDEMVA
jgi:hypothetical protein